jgi:hypothetical protein
MGGGFAQFTAVLMRRKNKETVMRIFFALVTAASLVAVSQSAPAAQQDQTCDVRGVKVPGCEPSGLPGGKMLPTGTGIPHGPGPTNPPPRPRQ